jgi:hypothetical protein
LGRTIGELLELPDRELQRWARYWAIEPWGPHRDNIHTAMLCVQVLRPYLPDNSKIGIDDFMLKDAKEIKHNRMKQLVSQMGAAAARKPTAKPAQKAKRRGVT